MARDVLILLAAHAGKPKGDHPNVAWPSIDEMAATLGVKPHAIKMGVAELKAVGLVHVQSRNRRLGQSNVYTLAAEEPFHVAEPATNTGGFHVAESATQKGTKKPGSGCHIDTDQVAGSVQNQVGDSCSNGANNLSVEPTIEPPVLNVPADALRARQSGKTKRRHDEERDQRDLQRIVEALAPAVLNGKAETEARRLLSLCTTDQDREFLVESLAEVFEDPGCADMTVTAKIARACALAMPF
jgi:hypothetical protein